MNTSGETSAGQPFGVAAAGHGKARGRGRGAAPQDPRCRACGRALALSVLDLGYAPVASTLLPASDPPVPDTRFPLHLRVCEGCWLAQTDAAAAPADVFTHAYHDHSPVSGARVTGARQLADRMRAEFGLGPASLAVGIGSNDGYLLRWLAGAGVPVLGIEPSARAGLIAAQRGVPSLRAFFDESLGLRLARDGRRPALVAALNVLSQVPDPAGFLRGVAALLTGEAVLIAEFPHLLAVLRGGHFDMIHHKHCTLLSLIAAEGLFAAAGLRVFAAEECPAHGGGLRVFACLAGAARPEAPGVARLRDAERAAGLDRPDIYRGFRARAEETRAGLMDFLTQAQDAGRLVAAYGASARGNTLLNWCAVAPDLVACCADRNPAKAGSLLPGSRIPVVSPGHLRARRPDYILILPWNLRDEIIGELSDLRARGTQFVTAVPDLSIVA
ncbi:MAG: methyltransferase domain-containing protein [Paracoccaceae bacterium]